MYGKYQTEDDTTTLKGWISFYPHFNSSLYLEKAGYFDERPELHISVTQIAMLFLFPFFLIQSFWFILLLPLLFFGWGKLYIHLPIKTGIQDCESAAWGFNYHNNTIWIYIGGGGNFEGGKKWKTIKMPWDLTWVRTSTLMKDGYDWFHETKTNRIDWISDKNGERIGSYEWLNKNKWKETHPYVDSYDGKVVNATIGVSEREWRPLGMKWTNLFSKKSRTIDVEFDQEVGARKGSWKGGTIGCGYELLNGETPLQCLRRMERERKF